MLVQFDSLAELWPPSIPTMTRPKRDIEFSRRFKVHKEADFKQDKWRLAPSVYLSIYDVLNSYNTGTLSDILKHFKVHVRPFFTRFWSQLDGAVWTWSCFFFTERALLRCEKPAEAGLLDLTQKTKKKKNSREKSTIPAESAPRLRAKCFTNSKLEKHQRCHKHVGVICRQSLGWKVMIILFDHFLD